jgi:secreted Zn-dependent insulinase-like peptidase
MGTRKYPDESEYMAYLSRFDGHANAYTDAEVTNYYFAIKPSALDGALER